MPDERPDQPRRTPGTSRSAYGPDRTGRASNRGGPAAPAGERGSSRAAAAVRRRALPGAARRAAAAAGGPGARNGDQVRRGPGGSSASPTGRPGTGGPRGAAPSVSGGRQVAVRLPARPVEPVPGARA